MLKKTPLLPTDGWDASLAKLETQASEKGVQYRWKHGSYNTGNRNSRRRIHLGFPLVVASTIGLIWYTYFLAYTPCTPGSGEPGCPVPKTYDLPVDVTWVEGTTIPKLVHQTWKSSNTTVLPVKVQKAIRTWQALNPGYHYRLWTDTDALDFIGAEYPHLLPAYSLLPEGAFRADLFRYLVLDKFGGIYADIDVEALKPVDDWLRVSDPPKHVPMHAPPAFAAPVETEWKWEPNPDIASKVGEIMREKGGPVLEMSVKAAVQDGVVPPFESWSAPGSEDYERLLDEAEEFLEQDSVDADRPYESWTAPGEEPVFEELGEEDLDSLEEEDLEIELVADELDDVMEGAEAIDEPGSTHRDVEEFLTRLERQVHTSKKLTSKVKRTFLEPRATHIDAIYGIELDSSPHWAWWDVTDRQIEIVQWTMATAPGHPIIKHTISKALEMIEWASSDPHIFARIGAKFAGPAVLTDALADYIAVHGRSIHSLANMREPVVVNGVEILTMTAFNPSNEGQAGYGRDHPQSLVDHKFMYSWKGLVKDKTHRS